MGGNSSSLKQKVDALNSTPFFMHLTEDEIKQFAKFFQVRQIKPKKGKQTFIYRQGNPAETFYIIASGEIQLLTEDKKQDQKTTKKKQKEKTKQGGSSGLLCVKKSGDWFGETAMFDLKGEPAKRKATAAASCPCTLLLLNRENMSRYLETVDTLGKKVRTLMGNQMHETLSKISFLKGSSKDTLDLLSNLFSYRTLEAGGVVFEEGDQGRHLYVVSFGSVECVGKNDEGKETKFQDIQAGGYFGEIALMIDIPRTATVRATEKTLLLKLGLEDFNRMMEINPDVRAKFRVAVRERIARTLTKFSVPFFRHFDSNRFNELAAICDIEKLQKGEVVFRAGDKGSEFFLIIHGQVIVKAGDTEKELARLKEGKYFGEIALVTDQERTATIQVAEAGAVLLSISKENFINFFGDNQQAYAEFALKLTQNETPLLPVLLHPEGLQLFRTHLASEYSTENINFYEAVCKFEKIMDEEERRKVAAEILDTYIRKTAPQQVNIRADVRKSTEAQLEEKSLGLEFFSEAKEEILRLMGQDSFTRFKKSEGFKKLLEQVGGYSNAAPSSDQTHPMGILESPRSTNTISKRVSLAFSSALIAPSSLAPSPDAQPVELQVEEMEPPAAPS